MANLLTAVQGIGTLLGGISGITRINQGIGMIKSGGDLQAASFRNAATISKASASYNAQLEDIALNRQLDSTSRQLQRVLGEQKVQAAVSGFSTGSKSFLSVMNETLDMVDSQVKDMRSSSSQRKAAIMFEGEAAAVQAENQARNAEYQAEVAAYQARQQRSEAISGLVNQGITFLGNL